MPVIQWVEIGVDGLTCSQCTRNVELSLRKLDFIKDVQMDLENTNGKIFFRDNAEVDYRAIAKAVRNAGFSVRYLHSVVTVSNVEVSENGCLKAGINQFQFVKTDKRIVDGEQRFQLVGKEFMPAKEFKKWKLPEQAVCGPAAIYVTL